MAGKVADEIFASRVAFHLPCEAASHTLGSMEYGVMSKPGYSDVVRADASELMAALIDRIADLPREASRSQEYADLGGYESQYPRFQSQVAHLIGRLKRVHAEIGALQTHAHDWNSDDYCRVCGADGRA